MPTVAEQLRQAREVQNLSIYQVAETTKIRTDHVRALEEGDYSPFCAPVYIRGFVRTYANLLRLNVPQIMADLDQELSLTDKFRKPPSLPRDPLGWLDRVMFLLSRLNWRVTVAALLVLGALALGLWGVQVWRSQARKDPLSHLGSGLYQAPPARPGETLPLPRK